MTLTIELSPEREAALKAQAEARGPDDRTVAAPARRPAGTASVGVNRSPSENQSQGVDAAVPCLGRKSRSYNATTLR